MSKRAKRADRPNPRMDRNVYDRNGEFVKRKEKSNVIELNFPKRERKKAEIVPRNLHQEEYLMHLTDPSKSIVFAVGPAGTGKTLIPTIHAIRLLKAGEISKVVISRPNVAVDSADIGYLPGDILSKMTPWMLPILDVFAEYYSQAEIELLIQEKIVEIVPIAHIRGRTFKNCLILIDEAQGTTETSMKAILTRIGENSRMVVTGDLAQSDNINHNGLKDFITRLEKNPSNGIALVKFDRSDIERHKVIDTVLRLYGE